MSFFERLTRSVSNDPYEDLFEEERQQPMYEEERPTIQKPRPLSPLEDEPIAAPKAWSHEDDPEEDGELSVDVYQTADEVVVKALVAGVQPANLDISVTREMITITGSREEEREAEGDNYFHRELYWGTFSRTILLPEEIDVDGVEASEKHGILVIRMPKVNKKRTTKIKVKSR